MPAITASNNARKTPLEPNPYPSWREGDVVLRDGSTLHLRPTRAADEVDLIDFYARLSPESRTFRFFTGGSNFELAVARLLDVDYRRRYGLVATVGREARVVGHGFYAAGLDDRAEVALAVSDELQGRGVGTILLGHLAKAAAAAGITEFEAQVMYSNHKMGKVFQESGFAVRHKLIPGAIQFEFPTALSEEARERFEWRARKAAAAARQHVLEPADSRNPYRGAGGTAAADHRLRVPAPSERDLRP